MPETRGRFTGQTASLAPLESFLRGTAPLEWTRVSFVSDDPAKGLGKAPSGARISDRLAAELGEATTEVQLVTPYFVPSAAGTDSLVRLARRGVKVSVLTNSLAATNVSSVHSGYAKWRRALLQAGVALYEVKPGPGIGRSRRSLFDSSASSLHAKVFALDRSQVFIGSMNFDPRSVRHNTECGLVIDSEATARAIAAFFETRIREVAYEVRLDEQDRLVWHDWRDGRLVLHRREPEAGLLQRFGVAILRWLPLDSLL
jgi:putative cardiolipin synthase